LPAGVGFVPFKASGGSTSVFVLYTNGQLTLNRGYLIDGGMAPEPLLAVLDDQIRMLYPIRPVGREGLLHHHSAPARTSPGP
jgi:hypothetical protein